MHSFENIGHCISVDVQGAQESPFEIYGGGEEGYFNSVLQDVRAAIQLRPVSEHFYRAKGESLTGQDIVDYSNCTPSERNHTVHFGENWQYKGFRDQLFNKIPEPIEPDYNLLHTDDPIGFFSD